MSQPYRWWGWICFFYTCVWLLIIILGVRNIFLVWRCVMSDWRCQRPWPCLANATHAEGCGCVLNVEVSWSWTCHLGIQLQEWIQIGISRRVYWLSWIVVHTWYWFISCFRYPLGWPLPLVKVRGVAQNSEYFCVIECLKCIIPTFPISGRCSHSMYGQTAGSKQKRWL